MGQPGGRAPRGVPVFVMAPLDIVSPGGSLDAPAAARLLPALAASGVAGLSVDAWWGVVERRPGEYDWRGYADLCGEARRHGLRVQLILSYHACGGNVGDDVSTPLPPWAVALSGAATNLYVDALGCPSPDAVSLWWDDAPLPGDPSGRTPLRAYEGFARSCGAVLREFMEDGTISHVAVGLGPCGELRYPSYRLEHWAFPGVGALQCYDGGARADLAAAAVRAGRPEWGAPPLGPSVPHLPPMPAQGEAASRALYDGKEAGAPRGHLSPLALCTLAAAADAPAASDAGRPGGPLDAAAAWTPARAAFFMAWYTESLLAHARRVVAAVQRGLQPGGAHAVPHARGPQLLIKLPGIHWLAGHPSRAAEAAAGLWGCRCDLADGAPLVGCFYARVARLAAELGAHLDFTCVEMEDEEAPHARTTTAARWASCLRASPSPAGAPPAHSAPASLVRHIARCAAAASCPLGGENALFTTCPRQLCTLARQVLALPCAAAGASSSEQQPAVVVPPQPAARMEAVTFLRACDALLRGWQGGQRSGGAAGGQPPAGTPPLSRAALAGAGLGAWDVAVVCRAVAAHTPEAAAAWLRWASPWARFVALTRCLAAGRPLWADAS